MRKFVSFFTAFLEFLIQVAISFLMGYGLGYLLGLFLTVIPTSFILPVAYIGIGGIMWLSYIVQTKYQDKIQAFSEAIVKLLGDVTAFVAGIVVVAILVIASVTYLAYALAANKVNNMKTKFVNFVKKHTYNNADWQFEQAMRTR